MSTYKYIPASIAASAKKGTNPKQQYIDLFQETLNEQFYNASDWWTIQEETYIGSQEYENIDVRIAHVINAETGLKLGDDWKTLLFQDVDHEIELGKQYIFDNNTWITVNIEKVKNLSGTCTIRRCNNTLRWVDEASGAFYEEPCAIEYLVKEPRDYATQGSPFMTPGGFLHIISQLNDRTNLIGENQRFLFGNVGHWTGYKVIGTGINDFTNTETYDNSSAKVLTLDLIANYVNDELDDIINGIADVNTNVYSIALSSGSISGSTSGSAALYTTILYNGDTVLRNITWASSNTAIATVSASSGSAIVTFVSDGTCEITSTITNNPAYDTCWVTVSASPATNSKVLISPNTNYILEGSSQQYSVYLYENDIQQADTFTITCTSGSVPSTNYTFVQDDDNHFTVTNILRYLTDHLTIECTSASVVDTTTFDIYLRGAWQYDSA